MSKLANLAYKGIATNQLMTIATIVMTNVLLINGMIFFCQLLYCSRLDIVIFKTVTKANITNKLTGNPK